MARGVGQAGSRRRYKSPEPLNASREAGLSLEWRLTEEMVDKEAYSS